MAFKIIISPEASREIDIATCYFKAKGLLEPFLKDFSDQITFLETMPLSRQFRYKQVRIHQFDKFNYAIHYVVLDMEVRILRILNQKQDF